MYVHFDFENLLRFLSEFLWICPHRSSKWVRVSPVKVKISESDREFLCQNLCTSDFLSMQCHVFLLMISSNLTDCRLMLFEIEKFFDCMIIKIKVRQKTWTASCSATGSKVSMSKSKRYLARARTTNTFGPRLLHTLEWLPQLMVSVRKCLSWLFGCIFWLPCLVVHNQDPFLVHTEDGLGGCYMYLIKLYLFPGNSTRAVYIC